MKRSIIIILFAMALSTQAQDFYAVSPSGHRLYYSITSAAEHTVSVVNPVNAPYEERQFYNNQFYGHDVDLVIPDTAWNGAVAYTVTGIGSQALNVPMHSLTIPRSMRTIGYHAFGTTSSSGNKNNSMRVLYFNADSLEYSGGLWAAYNYWVSAMKECERLDTVYIGEHVKYLPKKLFEDCDSMRCVVMGDSVRTIDEAAFSACYRLDSVRVSPTLQWIEANAFASAAITHIDLPDGLRYIGWGAFSYCNGLTEVMIPNTVDSIGAECFSDCHSLQRMHLSNNMTRLPDDCFIYNSALSEVDFGTSLEVIGERVFYNCTSLGDLVLPATLDTLKEGCFWGCNIASIRFFSTTPPATVGSIFPYGQNHTIPVYIPCGTYQAYHSASTWSSFPNLIERASFDIMVQANDTTMGYVVINDSASCTQPVVLTAIPHDGYHFAHWSDSSTANPRYIALTSDIALTAFFEQDAPAPDTVWRSVMVTSSADGVCEPYGSGLYADSSTVEIGYHLLDTVADGGHWQFIGWSDGPTENPRYITVTSDTAIVALFQWIDDTTTQAITQSSIQAITIYPNPSYGDVIVSVNQSSLITVIDQQGRAVIGPTPITSTYSIHRSRLSPGAYFVQITNDEYNVTRKMIIK